MDRFDDPFEGRPHYVPGYEDAGRQREAMLDYLASIQPQARSRAHGRRLAEEMIRGRGMKELVEQLGQTLTKAQLSEEAALFCMSHTDTLAEPLQWGHYADCHRGVAIELDTSLPPVNFAFPVTYAEEYPTSKVPRTEQPSWDGVKALFLTKSTHWRYEREYRAIRLDFPDAGVASHLLTQWEGDVAVADPRVVRAVTLGAKMDADAKRVIRDWVRQHGPHVEVWEAYLHRSRYEVCRERIA
jgi:hypothetical protein